MHDLAILEKKDASFGHKLITLFGWLWLVAGADLLSYYLANKRNLHIRSKGHLII